MTQYLITTLGDEAVWDARTVAGNRVVGDAHRAAGARAHQRRARLGCG